MSNHISVMLMGCGCRKVEW